MFTRRQLRAALWIGAGVGFVFGHIAASLICLVH